MKKKKNGIPTEEIAEEQEKTKGGRYLNKDIRWDRLDNTAHLFPVIAGESMSNVYRISVTLTELVQPEFLQEAMDIVLTKFDVLN